MPPPPPVTDRRSPERRTQTRRAEDRTEFARTAAAAAMAICGGLAILFVFFWLLGSIDIKHALAATIVAIVLAGVWVAGFVYRRRTEDPDAQGSALRHDRERRGF